MKKTYSKPDIVFEDFSLSTNIAAGCDYVPTNQSEGCGVQWGHNWIFTSELSCSTPITEGDPDYNGICYHNPTDNNVFYS